MRVCCFACLWCSEATDVRYPSSTVMSNYAQRLRGRLVTRIATEIYSGETQNASWSTPLSNIIRGYRKQANDEIRRAALEAMGYRVFLLTKPQLYNQMAFEGFARPILNTLGRRMPKRTSKFQQTQYDLRKMLLFEPSWILRRACRM